MTRPVRTVALLTLAILPVSALALEPCTVTAPDGARATLLEELSTRSDPNDPLAAQLEEELGEAPDFCSLYELGRYYGRIPEAEPAVDYLSRSLKVQGRSEALLAYPVSNVLGYFALEAHSWDAAVAHFEKQLQTVDALPESEAIKVYNNLGYTMIQLGRYEQAEEYLTVAKGMGSRFARSNLEVVASIRSTLETGDIDAPGVFGVAFELVIADSSVEPRLAAAKTAFGADELGVFAMGNDHHSLVLEPYVSYRRGLELVGLARDAGYPDAYLTSLSEWRDESADFLGVAE